MAKFNTPAANRSLLGVVSPIVSTQASGVKTALGHQGYTRDAKGELFTLAVSNFVGETAFHESKDARDERFRTLTRTVAVEDPDWTAKFAAWLRGEGNMRSASLVVAAEYVKSGAPNGRAVVNSVLQRADEPGEMLAYWIARYGKNVPQPVKRGVADAAKRLYSERNLLKYDGQSKGFRFGDVLELTHAKPKDAWQGDLFKHAIDRRHSRNIAIRESLSMLRARAALEALPVERRRLVVNAAAALHADSDANAGSTALREAGMTWESLAGWLQGPMDKVAWEAMIPSMSVMALIRNLRNFDEAGVSDAVAQQVIAKITNPLEIAKSRQFPFRWLAAYNNAPSLRWSYPLELALNASLENVPALGGNTLILVDRSPSMWHYKMSQHGTMSWADAAAVFGSALALRAEKATLVEFGSENTVVPFKKTDSLLKLIGRYTQGDGTDIPRAVKDNLRSEHTRVVIITDEQTEPGYLPSNVWGYNARYGNRYANAMPTTKIDDLIPREVPVHMWNLAGYAIGALPTGGDNRHLHSGLTDQAFRMIPLLENRKNGRWPWEI